MIHRVIFLFCILLAFYQHAHAEETTDATVWRQAILIPSFYGMADSENFTTTRYKTGFMPLYEHGDKYTGIQYQRNQFSQNGWTSYANQVELVTKAINPRSALGYNLNVAYNRENNFGLLVTDSQYSLALTDSLRAELLLNRDRVETQGSITNNVYYTMPAASIEFQPFERLTLVAMGGDMFFSDTNTRAFMRLKGIYTLIPDYGITAQIRYRQYHDSNTNVINNYFNPENYYEGMGVLAIRKRYEGWMFNGTAGLGRQSINNQPSTTTKLLELGATSPISGALFFRSTLGYGKSAGFLGPDYSYRYVKEELVYAF